MTLETQISNRLKNSLLWPLYARPGFLLRRASQIASSLAANECAKSGLIPPQHAFLIVLSKCPGLDQRTLGSTLGIDRVTSGQVLRALESRGLIQRIGSHKDGRRKLVYLTPNGKRNVRNAQAAMNRVSARLMSVFSPAQRIIFSALLLRMVVALNGESGTPVEVPRVGNVKSRTSPK